MIVRDVTTDRRASRTRPWSVHRRAVARPQRFAKRVARVGTDRDVSTWRERPRPPARIVLSGRGGGATRRLISPTSIAAVGHRSVDVHAVSFGIARPMIEEGHAVEKFVYAAIDLPKCRRPVDAPARRVAAILIVRDVTTDRRASRTRTWSVHRRAVARPPQSFAKRVARV